jgi:hypothetical protein
MIRIYKILALTIIFIVASSSSLQAQTDQDVFEVNFQKREAGRREVIARVMMFEEQEAKKFWSMYDEYRVQEKKFQQRRLTMLKKLENSIVGMSEEFAGEIVSKALALELDKHSAKQKFISKLEPVLPKARYFRYYQLETKLAARFTYKWTQRIPLAVTEEEAKKLEKLLEGKG